MGQSSNRKTSCFTGKVAAAKERKDQIERAEEIRQTQSCKPIRRSRFQLLALKVTGGFGAGLVRPGENLQCRCGAVINAQSKRSTSFNNLGKKPDLIASPDQLFCSGLFLFTGAIASPG
jgi:hypothetical protein